MKPAVTLYTKTGCKLCQDTYNDLQALAAEFDLTIDTVDITSSPELLRRYQHEIPVLKIAQGPTLSGTITREAILEGLAERKL